MCSLILCCVSILYVTQGSKLMYHGWHFKLTKNVLHYLSDVCGAEVLLTLVIYDKFCLFYAFYLNNGTTSVLFMYCLIVGKNVFIPHHLHEISTKTHTIPATLIMYWLICCACAMLSAVPFPVPIFISRTKLGLCLMRQQGFSRNLDSQTDTSSPQSTVCTLTPSR